MSIKFKSDYSNNEFRGNIIKTENIFLTVLDL